MTKLSGTPISSRIVPQDSEDTYATHDRQYGLGGWREVDTLIQRDAISAARRTKGMVVYVIDEDLEYTLGADLITWTARPPWDAAVTSHETTYDHTQLHSHSNATTLAKITEAAGLPLWNGGAWPGSGAGTAEDLTVDTTPLVGLLAGVSGNQQAINEAIDSRAAHVLQTDYFLNYVDNDVVPHSTIIDGTNTVDLAPYIETALLASSFKTIIFPRSATLLIKSAFAVVDTVDSIIDWNWCTLKYDLVYADFPFTRHTLPCAVVGWFQDNENLEFKNFIIDLENDTKCVRYGLVPYFRPFSFQAGNNNLNVHHFIIKNAGGMASAAIHGCCGNSNTRLHDGLLTGFTDYWKSIRSIIHTGSGVETDLEVRGRYTDNNTASPFYSSVKYLVEILAGGLTAKITRVSYYKQSSMGIVLDGTVIAASITIADWDDTWFDFDEANLDTLVSEQEFVQTTVSPNLGNTGYGNPGIKFSAGSYTAGDSWEFKWFDSSRMWAILWESSENGHIWNITVDGPFPSSIHPALDLNGCVNTVVDNFHGDGCLTGYGVESVTVKDSSFSDGNEYAVEIIGTDVSLDNVTFQNSAFGGMLAGYTNSLAGDSATPITLNTSKCKFINVAAHADDVCSPEFISESMSSSIIINVADDFTLAPSVDLNFSDNLFYEDAGSHITAPIRSDNVTSITNVSIYGSYGNVITPDYSIKTINNNKLEYLLDWYAGTNLILGPAKLPDGSHAARNTIITSHFAATLALDYGNRNTLYGDGAGGKLVGDSGLSTASYNSCEGNDSGGELTTGSGNMCVGNRTLGSSNLGTNGLGCKTGDNNTAVGRRAGIDCSNGTTKALFLGSFCGPGVSSGTDCTLKGYIETDNIHFGSACLVTMDFDTVANGGRWFKVNGESISTGFAGPGDTAASFPHGINNTYVGGLYISPTGIADGSNAYLELSTGEWKIWNSLRNNSLLFDATNITRLNLTIGGSATDADSAHKHSQYGIKAGENWTGTHDFTGATFTSSNITLNGQASRTLRSARNTTADTAGNNLTIDAGGATSGATNKNGGILSLFPGETTGNGKTEVIIGGWGRVAASTSDNTFENRVYIPSSTPVVCDNSTLNTLFTVTVDTKTPTSPYKHSGGAFSYTVMATEGTLTDAIVESGFVAWGVVKKTSTNPVAIISKAYSTSVPTQAGDTITTTFGYSVAGNVVTFNVKIEVVGFTADIGQIRVIVDNNGNRALTIS